MKLFISVYSNPKVETAWNLAPTFVLSDVSVLLCCCEHTLLSSASCCCVSTHPVLELVLPWLMQRVLWGWGWFSSLYNSPRPLKSTKKVLLRPLWHQQRAQAQVCLCHLISKVCWAQMQRFLWGLGWLFIHCLIHPVPSRGPSYSAQTTVTPAKGTSPSAVLQG